jgi:O-antigen/teichoic acid export membrane protein
VTAAWYRDHRDLIDNTVSLVGSAAVTSGLGFAFWWVAARLFDADAVGLASAAVSAMLLLSTLGVFGLDALMLSEIPRARATAGRLTSTAVIAAFVSSALLGLAFAAARRTFSENLRAHFALAGATAVFALGVGLTAPLRVRPRVRRLPARRHPVPAQRLVLGPQARAAARPLVGRRFRRAATGRWWRYGR